MLDLEKCNETFYTELVLVCNKLNRDRYPPYRVFCRTRREDNLDLKDGIKFIEGFIARHIGMVSEAERKKLYIAFISATLWYLKLKSVPQTPLQAIRMLSQFDYIMELNFPGYVDEDILAPTFLGRERRFATKC